MESDNLALGICFVIAVVLTLTMPEYFGGGPLRRIGKVLGTVVALYLLYKFLGWLHFHLSTH